MQLCVIGGSGFLGTHFFETVTGMPGISLGNLDKQMSRGYPSITRIVDVRDAESLNKALANADVVLLLAAEHRDDVSPVSQYYDVNVKGAINVLNAMDRNNVKNIIFTSSVAVYGLNKQNPDESHPVDPFNHYGKTKWEAEEELRNWYQKAPEQRSLTIIRPTVIFGENNRGNVFNLLRQIASGRFLMIGNGQNRKSMAYVKNVAAFIKYLLTGIKPGYQVFNYVDNPDITTKELVSIVETTLNKKVPSIRVPRSLGILGGICFDGLAFITRKKYTISSVRVKKFCATTQFNPAAISATDFKRPYTLSEGLQRTLQHEFITQHGEDRVLFEGE